MIPMSNDDYGKMKWEKKELQKQRKRNREEKKRLRRIEFNEPFDVTILYPMED
jgi:hypothetical protein